jgi:hypothetical protein
MPSSSNWQSNNLSQCPRKLDQHTVKIEAYLAKAQALGNVSEMTQLAAPSGGFAEHEVVAVAAVAQNIEHADDHVTSWQVQRDMESSGFTKIATTFALRVLVQREFLAIGTYVDTEGNGESYKGYSLTHKGWEWVIANQSRFALRKAPNPLPARPPAAIATRSGFDDMDDDLPF